MSLPKAKTEIGIIGAGPAGLTLALLLHRAGIECTVIESKDRQYVESRTRAGLLEQNTVDLFNELHVADRLNREGMKHRGVWLSVDEERIRVPFDELTEGRCIYIYGQQEVVKDLISACESKGIQIQFNSRALSIKDVDQRSPQITFEQDNQHIDLSCRFVAGCDGFHGVSRTYLPEGHFQEFRKEYPFSWLGILAHAAPSSEELIYAYHQRGFALHSLRSAEISRLYLQVEEHEILDNWSDERIWEELNKRLRAQGFVLNTGKIFEKSITPMRSFMIDKMQYGNLFLAGDAAHIVPPTGGKGLNLAVADIEWLARALIHYYKYNDDSLLKTYSADCLRRIWRAQDFSNFMTYLFHKQAEHGSFEYQLQKARFDYLKISRAHATTIAENYVGLKEI